MKTPLSFGTILLGWVTAFATIIVPAAAEVVPNRTVPKVDPPRTALEFASGTPSTSEILQVRVFEESLVPIGCEPTPAENGALGAALLRFSQRTSPDDFGSLTEFLAQHPKSAWRAALLTDLGLEYYGTAHYTRALEAWQEAWLLGQNATDARGKFLADRAVCELAGLYSRLGRMTELEALLKSVERRIFLGGASERINLAREALSMMHNQPGVSFRCGPLALRSILTSKQRFLTSSPTNAMMEIFNSASTQQGFSLPQVAELSKKVGLNYQMAFRVPLTPSDGERVSAGREKGDFIVPSVVHWKVGHYAALVRKEGDRYLLEDPTFGNTVWATKEALAAETSGYFLIPPGDLPRGWRSVDAQEGGAVWGRGVTGSIDPDNYTAEDFVANCSGAEESNDSGLFSSVGIWDMGMAISRVHLGIVNLQIKDTPVGYTPPVGPSVHFRVRYNQRDYLQPASEISSRFGPNWTHDWFAYIGDNPGSPLANVKYFMGGGGARTFTGFDSGTQTFAPQQFNQAQLQRTGANSYEMLFPDGSKKIFGLRASSRVYLTQVVDPAGNAITLTWDGNLRLAALTDAIGQVTTISYNHPSETELITKVTDPFGRFATFDYKSFDLPFDLDNNTNTPPTLVPVYTLTNITDVIGLASKFSYVLEGSTNLVLTAMTTPYGTSTFLATSGPGSIRALETLYPDGSRDRVEYNQTTNLVAFSDPPEQVPQGMVLFNQWLHGRNTFYWSRNAYAQGHGDYSKAKIYHWLHSPNIATTSGILESTKEPLEWRVSYNYAGQNTPSASVVGDTDRPTLVGRVLDDGSTQLYTYAYNRFGHVTNSIDPLGRELSYIYATNGIDLQEARQTRGANNELLSQATYNTQHQPLTMTDAAGQTTTNTYNARGQVLTTTNPKGETTAFAYNADGYLTTVDGPLPGTNDQFTFTYDAFGRARTQTDESGYTLTFDYDAMDRITTITHPDAAFSKFTYARLDLVANLDRAGRQTLFEYDSIRQLTKQTDSLGRVTRFEWCSCGSLGSLTDSMGRTTEWHSDVQGRPVSKQYADGSTIRYFYENATSRLRQIIDERQQVTQYAYNGDNSLKSLAYANSIIPTPGASYIYDSDYGRVTTMTDGTGTTRYSYHPITTTPTLGAGELASEDGPLADDTITFGYDELGRLVHRAINGVDLSVIIDAAGRRVGRTSALGAFTYAYAGASDRVASRSLPNSQAETRAYGNTVQDLLLQRITYTVGATPVSEFLYGHDVPKGRVATWSQQAGAQPPNQFSFGYDAVNQLLSAVVTNAGTLVNTFVYTYDPVGNRLTEQVGSSNYFAAYNALNQITAGSTPGNARTNEWDALDRLVAVNAGNQRTEFTYDGLSRMVAIRQLVNGFEVSRRQFVWCGLTLCEERDVAGAVIKRFFGQGMKVESGPNAGNYYYTRDHLSSIREITDASGNVRARYAYDPYGRRTKLAGDMDADFGFGGMFWSAEVNLNLTLFRAYDPELGRWLSRDPLQNAEVSEGPNLYAYVANDPVNLTDPLGLLSIAGLHWTDAEWARWHSLAGKGEIVEVVDFKLRQTPTPRPGIDMIVRPKGDIMVRSKLELERWRPSGRVRQPYQVPYRRVSPPAERIPRPSAPSPGRGVGGGIVDMGMTILTMTDCNVVNGIFGLVRQGKGGSVNFYQDRMLKELEEIDPTP
jgi:RHS repeat-associated protein